MSILFTYENDDGLEISVTLPAMWIICDHCMGEGTTTRHVEPDGGGFTASEWREACDGDADFAEDYFSGKYDRACGMCKGSGKLQVVDEEVLTQEQKEHYKAYCDERAASAAYDAEERYMRRMGY